MAERTTWTRADPDPAAVARLETELADTRAALNLARERAEDAEADLEEARLKLDQFRAEEGRFETTRREGDRFCCDDNPKARHGGLAGSCGQVS